jgi:hypothetical protein
VLFIQKPHNSEIWARQLNIPESGNGIPDILDEVQWEPQRFLNMQEDNKENHLVNETAINYSAPLVSVIGYSNTFELLQLNDSKPREKRSHGVSKQ